MFLSTSFHNRRGFTFIEVMVTLVILTVGTAAIFKSFLISLDQIDYLTHRLYAANILDNIFFDKERSLTSLKEISTNLQEKILLNVGPKRISFDQKIKVSAIESYPDLFAVDLFLTWQERDRTVTLQRSGYIRDSSYQHKNPNP